MDKAINRERIFDVGFIPATREEIDVRVADENKEKPGYVAGWASTEALDSYDSIVVAGAFEDSISNRGLKGPKSVKLLLHHDREKIAGAITRLEYVGPKLWIEAQLALSIGYVRDVYEISKITGGLNFSVGFYLEDYRWGDKDEGEDTLFILKADLIEVSIVTFPANHECTMDVVRSEKISTVSDFEKSLVTQGVVKSRNDAKRVTLAVKRDLHVFGAVGSQVEPAEKSNRPMLDEKFAALADKISSIRSSIAPEAKPNK
jgi:HK97 family phage prohead protease